jgi:hypothetical protein
MEFKKQSRTLTRFLVISTLRKAIGLKKTCKNLKSALA